MRIAMIADSFPPQRSSAAVQLMDLSLAISAEGHDLTVILPSHEVEGRSVLSRFDDFQILYLKAPRTKDLGYFQRTINEVLMPFFMRHNFNKSSLIDEKWDAVVWYSPSIFLGPMVKKLKEKSGCKAYLIIRDIFPQWAADLGLIRKGIPYFFFKLVANYQYSLADIIGVQTRGNLIYFETWKNNKKGSLEVLPNWLSYPGNVKCSIRLQTTKLAKKKIFVYAGNMGVAQGMANILELANHMQEKPEVGFLFVGRGSAVPSLQKRASDLNLENVLFFDEIPPEQIPDLYSQCCAGIVSLDFRHKSHNIPGKFLTYIQSGLPCLINVNPNNDLTELVRRELIGRVCETNRIKDLVDCAINLLEDIEKDPQLSTRCRAVFEREFTAQKIAKQIVSAF